tara:strand:+ start:225 stop:1055 length:831 start_codon:yes stop_codon:yes gene_type:complete
MDGSFLSTRAAVEASRPFVCIRLATYENQDEVDFMKTLYVSFTGEIANTMFALLSPDGKTRLSEADRSPAQVFGGVIQRRASQPGAAEQNKSAAARMVESMEIISLAYPGKKGAAGAPWALPCLGDLRMAVNVAACDNQPLLIVYAEKPGELARLEKALQPIAWSKEIIGRTLYVAVTDAAEYARHIKGEKPAAGYALVAPEPYGRHATPLLAIDGETKAESVRKQLIAALALYNPPPKDFEKHEAEGLKAGIQWKPKTPITDRSRGQRGRARRRP